MKDPNTDPQHTICHCPICGVAQPRDHMDKVGPYTNGISGMHCYTCGEYFTVAQVVNVGFGAKAPVKEGK